MADHAGTLRLHLSKGPLTARQLADYMGVSQPTVSRTISVLGDEVLRFGAGPSIHYTLRDTTRGFGDIPVHRVAADGTLHRLGGLVPVRPEGFVMREEKGSARHSHGLPWWLLDMCPQGFLGRAYAERHAAALGLPPRLSEWTDAHMLRALIAHGDDVVGNLLVGDLARQRFLDAPRPVPVDPADYPRCAEIAERGDIPGSSAGGEQPKFAAFAECRHVLVKFTAANDNPISCRWRDLLAVEHLAAQVLQAADVPAVDSRLRDIGGRRFLEVDRFDRVGTFGRRALHSLAALEAEFVGDARAPWPVLTRKLASQGVITPQAAERSALLYAFGTLIGNTDMHNGNLSFVADGGRPYDLAPAYDMLPMGFAPRATGALPDRLPPLRLHPEVSAHAWRCALELAEVLLNAMSGEARLSAEWRVCVEAMTRHLDEARAMIGRLG